MINASCLGLIQHLDPDPAVRAVATADAVDWPVRPPDVPTGTI